MGMSVGVFGWTRLIPRIFVDLPSSVDELKECEISV
jgi:hypothetical protein